jgi:Integrase core domain
MSARSPKRQRHYYEQDETDGEVGGGGREEEESETYDEEDEQKAILENYTNPPHPTAFSGVHNVARYYSIPSGRAAKILAHSDVYGLHREYKKAKVKNPYYIRFRRQQLQVDLIEVRLLSADNDGYNYLVCGIDCFSKFIWVRATLNKTAKTVLKAMKDILKDMGEKPHELFCDRGSELKNKWMIPYLKEEGIKLVHPSSEVKAGIVERVNKSLQNLIYRFMTHHQTKRYIDHLDHIVAVYNNRPHRSIDRLTPTEAEESENAERVGSALEKHYQSCERPNYKIKFKKGDIVRYKTSYGDRFARGYDEQFSREQCKIVEVKTNMAIPMYTLQSLDTDEVIKGGFYQNELTARLSDENTIERVLLRRRVNGVEELYVKWLDFGDQHNRWILASDVTREYNPEAVGDDQYGSVTPTRPPLSPPSAARRTRKALRGEKMLRRRHPYQPSTPGSSASEASE